MDKCGLNHKWVNTEITFEWDDNLQKYVEAHSDGFCYNGEWAYTMPDCPQGMNACGCGCCSGCPGPGCNCPPECDPQWTGCGCSCSNYQCGSCSYTCNDGCGNSSSGGHNCGDYNGNCPDGYECVNRYCESILPDCNCDIDYYYWEEGSCDDNNCGGDNCEECEVCARIMGKRICNNNTSCNTCPGGCPDTIHTDWHCIGLVGGQQPTNNPDTGNAYPATNNNLTGCDCEYGCIDVDACNYNPDATDDDGSCTYVSTLCTLDGDIASIENYCGCDCVPLDGYCSCTGITEIEYLFDGDSDGKPCEDADQTTYCPPNTGNLNYYSANIVPGTLNEPGGYYDSTCISDGTCIETEDGDNCGCEYNSFDQCGVCYDSGNYSPPNDCVGCTDTNANNYDSDATLNCNIDDSASGGGQCCTYNVGDLLINSFSISGNSTINEYPLSDNEYNYIKFNFINNIQPDGSPITPTYSYLWSIQDGDSYAQISGESNGESVVIQPVADDASVENHEVVLQLKITISITWGNTTYSDNHTEQKSIMINNWNILGCTDPTAFNYNDDANTDDGGCCVYNEGWEDVNGTDNLDCTAYDVPRSCNANCPDNETCNNYTGDSWNTITQCSLFDYTKLRRNGLTSGASDCPGYRYECSYSSSCILTGCMESNSPNQNISSITTASSGAQTDYNSCNNDEGDVEYCQWLGCTDDDCTSEDCPWWHSGSACNYQSDANVDDGSCYYRGRFFFDTDYDGLGYGYMVTTCSSGSNLIPYDSCSTCTDTEYGSIHDCGSSSFSFCMDDEYPDCPNEGETIVDNQIVDECGYCNDGTDDQSITFYENDIPGNPTISFSYQNSNQGCGCNQHPPVYCSQLTGNENSTGSYCPHEGNYVCGCTDSESGYLNFINTFDGSANFNDGTCEYIYACLDETADNYFWNLGFIDFNMPTDAVQHDDNQCEYALTNVINALINEDLTCDDIVDNGGNVLCFGDTGSNNYGCTFDGTNGVINGQTVSGDVWWDTNIPSIPGGLSPLEYYAGFDIYELPNHQPFNYNPEALLEDGSCIFGEHIQSYINSGVLSCDYFGCETGMPEIQYPNIYIKGRSSEAFKRNIVSFPFQQEFIETDFITLLENSYYESNGETSKSFTTESTDFIFLSTGDDFIVMTHDESGWEVSSASGEEFTTMEGKEGYALLLYVEDDAILRWTLPQ